VKSSPNTLICSSRQNENRHSKSSSASPVTHAIILWSVRIWNLNILFPHMQPPTCFPCLESEMRRCREFFGLSSALSPLPSKTRLFSSNTRLSKDIKFSLCEIWGFHDDVVQGLGLLRCDSVSVGWWLLACVGTQCICNVRGHPVTRCPSLEDPNIRYSLLCYKEEDRMV